MESPRKANTSRNPHPCPTRKTRYLQGGPWVQGNRWGLGVRWVPGDRAQPAEHGSPLPDTWGPSDPHHCLPKLLVL